MIGNVTTTKRRNKDRSLTFYLVWHEDEDGRVRQKRARLFKTEPSPTTASRKKWERRAAVKAAEAQDSMEQEPERPAPRVHREWRPMALNHALMTYLKSLDLHPSTIDAKDRILTAFVRHVGETSPQTRCVHQLSARHINGDPDRGYAGYRVRREMDGISTATLILELQTIRQWLDWCTEFGWIPGPVKFRIPKPEPTVRPRIIDTSLVRKIIADQGEPARRTLFIALAETGMRQAELKVCRIDSWDAQEKILTVPKVSRERTKIHHRSFPVGRELARGLDQLVGEPHQTDRLWEHNGRPLVRHINHWMDGFNATPKDFRRWFQYSMEKIGCPAGWIDDLMGHAPTGVRGHYTPGTTEDFRQYLQTIEDTLLEQ